MATLLGQNFDDFECAVSLDPIEPAVGGVRDAYKVQVIVDNTVLLQRRFDVFGWQLGHFEFFRLATAFQKAEMLLTEKLNSSLSLSGTMAEGALIQVGVPWFTVLLSGAVSRIGRYPPRIIVALTIDPHYKHLAPQLPEFDNLLGLMFHCTPAECAAFGSTLESELWNCRQRRKDLGIEADEDFVIPTPDEYLALD